MQIDSFNSDLEITLFNKRLSEMDPNDELVNHLVEQNEMYIGRGKLIETLNGKVKEMENQEKSRKKILKERFSEVRDLKLRNEILTKTANKLQSEVDEYVRTKAELENWKQIQERENSETLFKLEKMQKELLEKDAVICQLNNILEDKDNKNKEAYDFVKKVEAFKEKYVAVSQKEKKLKEEISALKDDYNAVSQNEKTLKIENSALKTRNARLKSKLKTKFSKLENDAINKELELTQDLEEYKAKVKEKNIANEYRYNKLVQNLKFFKSYLKIDSISQ